MREPPEPFQEEITSHYTAADEEPRLFQGSGVLEFARAQQLISRCLPPRPKVVLDVGGGPGAYSCWLARRGYAVHLIDPVAKHLDQAQQASAAQPDYPIASVSEGDARSLDWGDESCDAVLLMGPLYHLTDRGDRVRALAEVYRALRPGGVVFAKVINRFASLMDGLSRAVIDDPYFAELLDRDLSEGQHRNVNDTPGYFTTAFFHRPEELEAEVSEVGLTVSEVVAVQGPGWLARDLADRWSDPRRRTQLLYVVWRVEHEPTLLGVSQHFAVIAKK